MITGMERNGLDYRDIEGIVKVFDRVFFGHIVGEVDFKFGFVQYPSLE